MGFPLDYSKLPGGASPCLNKLQEKKVKMQQIIRSQFNQMMQLAIY